MVYRASDIGDPWEPQGNVSTGPQSPALNSGQQNGNPLDPGTALGEIMNGRMSFDQATAGFDQRTQDQLRGILSSFPGRPEGGDVPGAGYSTGGANLSSPIAPQNPPQMLNNLPTDAAGAGQGGLTGSAGTPPGTSLPPGTATPGSVTPWVDQSGMMYNNQRTPGGAPPGSQPNDQWYGGKGPSPSGSPAGATGGQPTVSSLIQNAPQEVQDAYKFLMNAQPPPAGANIIGKITWDAPTKSWQLTPQFDAKRQPILPTDEQLYEIQQYNAAWVGYQTKITFNQNLFNTWMKDTQPFASKQQLQQEKENSASQLLTQQQQGVQKLETQKETAQTQLEKQQQEGRQELQWRQQQAEKDLQQQRLAAQQKLQQQHEAAQEHLATLQEQLTEQRAKYEKDLNQKQIDVENALKQGQLDEAVRASKAKEELQSSQQVLERQDMGLKYLSSLITNPVAYFLASQTGLMGQMAKVSGIDLPEGFGQMYTRWEPSAGTLGGAMQTVQDAMQYTNPSLELLQNLNPLSRQMYLGGLGARQGLTPQEIAVRAQRTTPGVSRRPIRGG